MPFTDSIRNVRDYFTGLYADTSRFFEFVIEEFMILPTFIQVLGYIFIGYLLILGSFQFIKKVLLAVPKLMIYFLIFSLAAFYLLSHFI
ncbi:MAG: hypothetical protein FWE36_02015 [Erysipelotrichales bacterium]|nr:hypothetical protein [Erysipelotrichales bacterium]